MRLHFTLLLIAELAFSGCSINDDLRHFSDTVPDRINNLPWPALVPLGAFARPAPPTALPDARSMAARAANLRLKAADLRAHPVLDPARARAMRAALKRFAP